MLKSIINMYFFRKTYRKHNSHNFTYATNLFDINHIMVGKYTYGGIKINDWGKNDNKVIIGSYCSIGPNTYFLLGSDHNLNTITTYPLKVKKLKTEEKEAISKGNIELKDDVWVGANVTICSGITIGQGAVIGTGAVVTKDIPPYAIAVGVPAKVIKYRFSEEVITKFLQLDIVSLLDSVSEKNISLFYQEINENNFDEIISKLMEKNNE